MRFDDDCAAHRDAQAREEPFSEGLRARRLGLGAGLNPYSPGEIGHAEWYRGWRANSSAPKTEGSLNDFRKKVPPRSMLSAREAVTKYGDDWHFFNTPYKWDSETTHDQLDAAAMRMMERGEMGRV